MKTLILSSILLLASASSMANPGEIFGNCAIENVRTQTLLGLFQMSMADGLLTKADAMAIQKKIVDVKTCKEADLILVEAVHASLAK